MRILQIAMIALVVVVGFAGFVRWLEPRFAFFPSRGETVTPGRMGLDYTVHTIVTDDGERLRAWLLPGPNPRRLIVYFHGNGGSLSGWAPILSSIAAHGYTVLAPDYRGYGVSTGRPTERGLYRDAEATLKYVSTIAPPPTQVVYWGRSLGASVAAYGATRRPPDGLILESGFPDVRSLVRSSPLLAFLTLFSTYRFPTAAFLHEVRAPVLVMHGDADRVVSYNLGQALFDRITGPKQFVTIRGGDHNDSQPPDPPSYWNAVAEFTATLPTH